MNYITIAIVALTVLPILCCVLLGLLRGSRRSILRLVLVVVSLVLAFVLCGAVSTAILNAEVSNAAAASDTPITVAGYLEQMLGENIPGAVSNLLIAIVSSIVKIIVFLLLFLVFRFLTWAIAYPLCKLFVKPKTVRCADGSVKKKKRRLIGAAVGLVQGGIIAVCICIVMTGLLVQTNNVVTIAADLGDLALQEQPVTLSDDMEVEDPDLETDPDNGDGDVEFDPDDGYTNDDEQPAENPLEGLDEISGIIGDYADSGIAKFYQKIGGKLFNWISEVKTADGKKVTLSGQLDAIRGVVDMAKELIKLKDIDFANLLQEGNINSIKDIFDSLQAINGNLSKESRDTIKGVLESLGEEIGLPIDFSDVDLNEINFSKEGEIFTELFDYSNKSDITADDAKDIVEKIAESDLILGMLESQGDDVNLGGQFNDDGEHLDAIAEKINEMESSGEYDQSKIDSLRDIFGIK